MSGTRGFYNVASEDHKTAALFQNWAIFDDLRWADELLRRCGVTPAGPIRRVRWAYECNEFLDTKLQSFHKRNFIIPDIMFLYEDERGLGLLAFEAKKPHRAIDDKDVRKLMSYIDLPSTRRIARRNGCVLVSSDMVQLTRRLAGSFPILTWEEIMELQVAQANRSSLQPLVEQEVGAAIRRHFGSHGVGDFADSDFRPATSETYEEIERLAAPQRVRNFLKGSVCVNSVRNGDANPAPPLQWLEEEPTEEAIRAAGRTGQPWQNNADRMLCRWSFDWTPAKERKL